MNKSKFDKFITWLAEPSTIKAVVLFAGLGGVAVAPDRMEEIIIAATVLYGGIAAFVDKN